MECGCVTFFPERMADLESTLFLQAAVGHFKIGDTPKVNFLKVQKQQLITLTVLEGGSGGHGSERPHGSMPRSDVATGGLSKKVIFWERPLPVRPLTVFGNTAG